MLGIESGKLEGGRGEEEPLPLLGPVALAWWGGEEVKWTWSWAR